MTVLFVIYIHARLSGTLRLSMFKNRLTTELFVPKIEQVTKG
jgi:hypothetical protein